MSCISSSNFCENPLWFGSKNKTDMVTYHISESIIRDENGIEYLTYGIVAKAKDGAILKEMQDITLEKSALQKLVACMNQNKLALCHMHDVIEDFLAK